MPDTYKLTDEDKRLILTLAKYYEKEDESIRVQKLRQIKKLKFYWANISLIYWSDVARDYRIFANDQQAYTNDSNQGYYDKPVNVFRAFLETIIAALSIQIPTISCSPDDADNPDDQSTAKSGDKIAELIYKHNDAIFVWLRALYVYVTEGMVACKIVTKEDKAFGTYKEPQYKDEEKEAYQCPHCQGIIEDAVISGAQSEQIDLVEDQQEAEAVEFSSNELDEFQPDDEDADLHAEILNMGPVCPECGLALDPQLQKTKVTIPKLIGEIEKPKGRVLFDVKGEMYVKISMQARTQEETPYLIESYETSYVNVLECYRDDKELWEKLPKDSNAQTLSADAFEVSTRTNTEYREQTPENQVTVRNCWLRPAAFNRLSKEESDHFHDKFPDGLKAVIVNDLVVEGCNESLDDNWKLTKNPTSDFLSHDALGDLLVNIQDIINDLISLTLQLIEFGIPETFVDPSVIGLEEYGQREATPGMLTAAKNPIGGNLSQAFYTNKTASVSPEIFQFYSLVQQLGQFVSAAMPSLFGGSQEKGASKTASEYAMSRTASLQRLQTPWRMFSIWWKQIFGTAVPAYMKLMAEDEKYVQKDDNGNYVNVWLRKSEMKGKIGDIELESADTIPVSDEQKADMIMEIMKLNNEQLLAAMFSPDNLPFIRKVIKINEFKLPGEADRQKQFEEIQQLVQETPEVINPTPDEINQAGMAGMEEPEQQELPSIMPEELVDNHQIQAEVCRNWLVGDAGRLARVENPEGYKNVLLHMKMHLMMLNMQQMAMNVGSVDNSNPEKPTEEPGTEVKDGSDAITPVQ